MNGINDLIYYPVDKTQYGSPNKGEVFSPHNGKFQTESWSDFTDWASGAAGSVGDFLGGVEQKAEGVVNRLYDDFTSVFHYGGERLAEQQKATNKLLSGLGDPIFLIGAGILAVIILGQINKKE